MQGIGNPEPAIRSGFVNKLIPLLEDGDLLLSREEWRLTNPFIAGFWGHAAVYHQGQVIEAVGNIYKRKGWRWVRTGGGVIATDVFQWLYQKDHACARRAHLIDNGVRSQIGLWAWRQKGKGYDYCFWKGTKTFYCSELFVWAYNMVASVLKFQKATITPEDLYKSNLLFTIMDSTKGE